MKHETMNLCALYAICIQSASSYATQSERFPCPVHSRTKKIHLYLAITFVSYSYICILQLRLQFIQSLTLNFNVLTESEDEFLWLNWSDKALTSYPFPWHRLATPPLQAFHLQLLMKHINFNAEAFVELSS